MLWCLIRRELSWSCLEDGTAILPFQILGLLIPVDGGSGSSICNRLIEATFSHSCLREHGNNPKQWRLKWGATWRLFLIRKKMRGFTPTSQTPVVSLVAGSASLMRRVRGRGAGHPALRFNTPISVQVSQTMARAEMEGNSGEIHLAGMMSLMER